MPISLNVFVCDRYAAVYLAAGLENLLEEIILQCLPSKPETVLTASMFEHSIANNGDLWGLLQPYAHLNTGRTAAGMYHIVYFIVQPITKFNFLLIVIGL